MTEATLKSSWTKVKFGEVVRLCKDRSSDPEAEGIERYVGLEHLEPEDLRIRSWGLVAEGTTFTSRFKPGQVLFGKRRAYQRKVAVADFEGVCSGDIYIFESADPKLLLQELLPFICQTNAFFEHAVGTSAGSLSPRTNWKSLIEFEFFLPPIKKQENLVKLLQAHRMSLEALTNLLSNLRKLRSSAIAELVGPVDAEVGKVAGRDIFSLGQLATIVRGSTPRPAGDLRFFNGSYIPWITVGEITKDDGIHLEHTSEKLTEEGCRRSRIIPSRTVILSNSGWTLGIPKVLKITGCVNDGVAAFLDLKQHINSYFLYYRLLGMTEYMRKVVAAGGDQPNLNTARISNLKVALPPLSEQEVIVGNIGQIQSSIDATQLRLKQQKELMSRQLSSSLDKIGGGI